MPKNHKNHIKKNKTLQNLAKTIAKNIITVIEIKIIRGNKETEIKIIDTIEIIDKEEIIEIVIEIEINITEKKINLIEFIKYINYLLIVHNRIGYNIKRSLCHFLFDYSKIIFWWLKS